MPVRFEHDKNLRSVQRWHKPAFVHNEIEISSITDTKNAKDELTRTGIHTFFVSGIPIDFWLKGTKGKPLFVFLNPLVNRSKDIQLPVFVGQGVCPDLGLSSCLSISDPTLILDKDLRVSWFQGFPNFDLPSLVLEIISVYRHLLDAPFVVLCGGSSAGFANIKLLPKIPDCIALVWNAQTDISKFFPQDVLRYARLFDANATLRTSPEILRSHISTDVSNCINLKERQTLFALQNCSDDYHIKYHWADFLRLFEQRQDPSTNWLTPQIFALLGSWGEGHAPLPRPTLREILHIIAEIDLNRSIDWEMGKEILSRKLKASLVN